MDDLTPSGLTNAGANHLRLENSQLKQQLQTLQLMVKQRGGMAVAVLAEGLQSLFADAQQGDPNAAALLKALSKILHQLDDFESPLTVIRRP